MFDIKKRDTFSDQEKLLSDILDVLKEIHMVLLGVGKDSNRKEPEIIDVKKNQKYK